MYIYIYIYISLVSSKSSTTVKEEGKEKNIRPRFFYVQVAALSTKSSVLFSLVLSMLEGPKERYQGYIGDIYRN